MKPACNTQRRQWSMMGAASSWGDAVVQKGQQNWRNDVKADKATKRKVLKPLQGFTLQQGSRPNNTASDIVKKLANISLNKCIRLGICDMDVLMGF